MKKLLFLGLLMPLILSARSWQEIKQSGVLKAGVRSTTLLVYRPTNIKSPGFSYEMLRDFASFHNLKLEVKVVPSFGVYWKKDGINLNKTKELATPDIYKEIDLAAEIFTVTKRRQALINMTPYIDNVELLFGVKGDKARELKNLIGKSIITYEAMIFSKVLKTELEKQKVPFEIHYLKKQEGSFAFPKKESLNKKVVNLFLVPAGIKERSFAYEPVAAKQIDVGINDGIAVILKIFGNAYYRENLRPLFPAQAKKSQLAWGSEHKHSLLNQKLEEFFVYDKQTGNFSNRLKKYIGMSLKEYNDLINMIE